MSANINHPKYYGGEDNPLEVIKIIEYYKLGFNLGNVLKYILRAGRKGRRSSRLEDLKKAKHYLEYLIEKEERNAVTAPRD